MRQFFLIVLALALITSGLVIANQRFSRPDQQEAELPAVILSNLPLGYCPTQAEVYHTSRLSGTVRVPVKNCQIVGLRTLGLSAAETVVIKLPNALAFAINYTDEIDRYAIGVRVGDVNRDNIVDQQDEQLVIDNIFTESQNGDADMSGKVTADDLALVRINQAVGVARPDAESWRL